MDFTKTLHLQKDLLTTKNGFSVTMSSIPIGEFTKGQKLASRKAIMKILSLTKVLFVSLCCSMNYAESTPLQKAHEAYLKKDTTGMIQVFNEVLKGSLSKAEMNNIRGVLTKSFENGDSSIDFNVKLPQGLENLRLVSRLKNNKGTIGRTFEIKGDLQQGQEMKTLDFFKYPNIEILSKASNHYEWNLKEGHFYLKNKSAPILEDGLYRIVIAMENGDVLDTLIPLIDLNQSEFPRILQPNDQQTLLSRNPTLSWQFATLIKPNAYKTKINFESVLNNPPAYSWEVRCGYYSSDLTRSSASSCGESHSTGDKFLTPGRYVFSLNQSADRRIGPFKISTQMNDSIVVFIK